MYIEDLDLCKINLASFCSMNPSKSLLLTSNKRQANQVMKYVSEYLCSTKETKELFQIKSLDDWVIDIFECLSFLPHVDLPTFILKRPCSQVLWYSFLKRDSVKNNCSVESKNLSVLALDAYELMNSWGVKFPKNLNTLEHNKFIYWKKCYEKDLRKVKAIDVDGIYSVVIRNLENNKIIIPENIVLSGFVECPLRIAKLLRKFLSKNVKLCILSNKANKLAPNRYLKCNNITEEWKSAVSWMVDSSIKKPSGRYAIVSAQLDRQVGIAHRTLDRILRRQKKELSITFSISFDKSMIQNPIVRSAFLWLGILVNLSSNKSCDITDLGKAILSSSSFMGNKFFEPYSVLELSLRDKTGMHIDTVEMAELLSNCDLGSDFFNALSVWPDGESLLIISEWILIIRKSLFFICFSRYMFSEDSVRKIVELFDNLLNEFNCLSSVFGKVSANIALSLFEYFIESNKFCQYENRHNNIEVLDIRDVSLRNWDAIWIIGFNDGIFPGITYSNPFLPKDILHKFSIAHSSAECEFDWSCRIYKSISQCANELFVSYSINENGVLIQPSPFIDDSYQTLPNIGSYPSEEKIPIEYIDDSKGPRLLQSESIINGASVLELQSRNPLWAFARYRLGVIGLVPYYKDKSMAYRRGRFLHRVLELFWSEVQNYSNLMELSNITIESLLLKHIEYSLSIDFCLDHSFIKQLESERALKLLINWINIEKGRIQFLVSDLEDSVSLRYGSLVFNMRLDRIDILEDKAAIIDYKTGRNTFNIDSDWCRQRPINLQLLLYHMAFSQMNSANVISLVMVLLSSNGIEISGISSEDIGLPGVIAHSDFDDKLRELSSRVLMLADEYIEGIATNSIVKIDDLRFCDIMPFLRLNFNK